MEQGEQEQPAVPRRPGRFRADHLRHRQAGRREPLDGLARLSQPGRINAKTEERIHAAGEELNYRVNPIARALRPAARAPSASSWPTSPTR